MSKIFFSLIMAAIFAVCAFGQDLGSSNSLFRAPNPAAKKAAASKSNGPVKKTAAKKAAVASVKVPVKVKPRTGSKPVKTAVVRRVNNKTSAKSVTPSKNTASKIAPAKIVPAIAKNQPSESMVIIVGQPSTGDFNEAYEKAIEEGNTARDDRDYGKAETAYLRAQSLKTGDARAIYGLGNLFSDQQRWEEAERAYRTAVQLDSQMPEAFTALSYVLTQPIADSNLSARYAEAEATARTAIQLDPENATAFDQLGAALELRGIISAETEDAYRKAIKLDPNFALAYAHLGRLLRRKGDANGSAAAYRSSIQFSSDVPTMILVADVMQSQQKYLESEQLLRRALRDDPKNPTALFLLGRALTTRGSYAEAETVLKKSAEVSPNSFVSYILLGSMYARQDKLDDAEKSLRKALKLVSPNEKKRLAQEFEIIGDGYVRAGKDKDAVRVYSQAQELDGAKAGLSAKLAKAKAD